MEILISYGPIIIVSTIAVGIVAVLKLVKSKNKK